MSDYRLSASLEEHEDDVRKEDGSKIGFTFDQH
jgi:hypothetical protein